MKLEQDSFIPLYHQLKKHFENEILSGKLKPGTRFPSENELTKRYPVSRMTARKAVTELVKQGLLSRSNGKGTFVKSTQEPAFPGDVSKGLLGMVMLSSETLSSETSENAFVSQNMLEGFSCAARKKGFIAESIFLNPREFTVDYCIEHLSSNKSSSGFAFIGYNDYKNVISRLDARGIPCVTTYMKRIPHNSVIINQYTGIKKAVECLLLKRKRILYIGGDPEKNEPCHLRFNAFLNALKESEVCEIEYETLFCAGNREEAADSFEKYIASGKKIPEAIFAGTDIRAFAALDVLRKKNIDVPGKVVVAGYDNRPECKSTVPPLSSVDNPRFRVGEEMFEILAEIMKGVEGKNKVTRLLDTDFIRRESC